MSTLLDETATDVPVRDLTVNLSRLTAGPQDPSIHQNARTRQDISRVSREELEDRFLRLHEETLHLKQHTHKQDDKIKKLGTKLMRLVKDRGRMEQLAAGGAQPVSRVRDIEMEEMMEEQHEKVRRLQMENEGLKQRLLVTKQQVLNSQNKRPAPYGHVQSRVNTGMKKLRDDASSPSQTRSKSARSLEAGGGPPTGLLPRFGHNLLEEARAEIRNLENVIELQRSHAEEQERSFELLKDELRKKEAEHEQQLLQLRQRQTSSLRTHVNSNVTMIKLQKELAERSEAVTKLEARYLQLHESQKSLTVSRDAAMTKVNELSAQLKDERMKSLDVEKRLQSVTMANVQIEQLQERLSELEQERDQLKESNQKLLNGAFDVSQQQQVKEQQLKLQIAQLETALQADLVDKNEILDKIKAERETSEKLTEENQKLRLQVLEQKQKLQQLDERQKLYSKEGEYDVAELTEALLLIKTRKSQEKGNLSFLKEVEDGTGTVELRAAHAETIQELQKTRNLLSMESKICKDYKAELEAVQRKMDADRLEYEQKLERQAQLLDMRAAKIKKLEAQLRDIAYGAKAYVMKGDAAAEDEEEQLDETVLLERGENLLELQIVSVALSPSALELLGDGEPSTFCTYSFYLFELHSTPVVTGPTPRYGFTSKYVVSMDERFLDYLQRCCVSVELHQALGLDWRTLARGQLRLQQLLEREGKVHGSIPLVGTSDEARSFGSLDYWMRLRVPATETARLYDERVKAVAYVHSTLNQDLQQLSPPSSSSFTELSIVVLRCRGLRSRGPRPPSPYVVYKFSDFPDHPTATVHHRSDPDFNDRRSYSVPMDAELDRYLRSQALRFYVFDQDEEREDEYMGKAGVPLLALAQDSAVTGVFELIDPAGLPAGHIEVALTWRSPYTPPPGSVMTEQPEHLKEEETEAQPEEQPEQEEEEEEEDQRKAGGGFQPRSSLPPVPSAKPRAPLPKLRQKTLEKEAAATKKVTFVDPAAPQSTPQPDVTLAAQPAPEEDEDEEQSHVSEGQLLAAGSHSHSLSDVSEISDEITEDTEEAAVATEDPSGSMQSDSDDCIVHGQTAARKPSDRVRVEVLALSLKPGSRAARDSSVVRLFVEYSLLDLPTVETPLSLPKPPQGKSVNFNYSKVVPVDAENNRPRRQLLRDVLQGRNPSMETIRFTVVSEPPEEEEQDRECEDVGVAFVRIPEILEKQQDLTETSLDVRDVEDSSEVVGSLTVSVEGLEALQAIMEDREQDQELQ